MKMIFYKNEQELCITTACSYISGQVHLSHSVSNGECTAFNHYCSLWICNKGTVVKNSSQLTVWTKTKSPERTQYRTVGTHGFISTYLFQKSSERDGNTDTHVITNSIQWCNFITHSLIHSVTHVYMAGLTFCCPAKNRQQQIFPDKKRSDYAKY